MKKIILQIEGMTCSACSSGLEKYLSKQKGIKSANVNLILSLATIEYDNINKKDIEKHIKDAGFKSLGELKKIKEKETKKEDKIKLIILGLLIIFIMYINKSHMLNLPVVPLINHKNPIIISTISLILTLIHLFYGKDIIKSGVNNLIHKIPNMDTLIMLSVTVSFMYSVYGYINILIGNIEHLKYLYFESTCMIIYFIKLGKYIENISKDKTVSAIKELVQITPENAIIKIDNNEKIIDIDEIKEGDTLICKTGKKIAVDGIITKGQTHVDESFITGESKPVLKTINDKVIAGSILYDGYIEYTAQKIGKDTTISNLVKLVIESTNTKTKIQKLADKISGYFVPTIMLISAFSFIINLILGNSLSDAIIHLVTVLVVACPCALGLAVPLVVMISSGISASHGLFIKNSFVLEIAKNIDTICFDKTGTLTFGKPKIFKYLNYSNLNDKKLLNIVSNLEKHSSHPISTAFNVEEQLEVTNFKTINGMGLSGTINKKEYYLGNLKLLENLNLKNEHKSDYDLLIQNGCSIIFIVENKEVIGLIGVRDIIRTDVRMSIEKLKNKNIEVIMLTGDNETTSKIISKELGINKVIANVLPDEKVNYIKSLVNAGKKVMMVGDGINDAPSLVSATIGISINDGTDVAMDSSDVILMNNDINNIIDLIDISKSSYKIIKQNLFWAFFYNIIMIPVASGLLEPLGLTMSPMLGSIAMTFSSLTVVLNSLRLRRTKNGEN